MQLESYIRDEESRENEQPSDDIHGLDDIIGEWKQNLPTYRNLYLRTLTTNNDMQKHVDNIKAALLVALLVPRALALPVPHARSGQLGAQ